MNTAGLQDALVITLNVASMLAMGLELTAARLGAAVTRWRPIGIGLAVNLVAAPLLAWALVAGLSLPAAFGLGFLLCAAAPGGNTGPLFTANARGDTAYSVALVVLLSFASVASVPLLMRLFGGGSAGSSGDAFASQTPVMVQMILTYQIAPLVAGMAVHSVHPRFALRVAPVARIIGNVALLILTVALMITKGDLIFAGGALPLIAIEMFVLLAIASGLLLGSPRDPTARALALTSCTRNLSLALLFGSQIFRDQPEVMLGVLAYGLLWLSTAMPVSFWLGKKPGSESISDPQ